MNQNRKIDVKIKGSNGTVILKGIPEGYTATKVKAMKANGKRDIVVRVKNISQIDILKSNGDIEQTVLGGKNVT